MYVHVYGGLFVIDGVNKAATIGVGIATVYHCAHIVNHVDGGIVEEQEGEVCYGMLFVDIDIEVSALIGKVQGVLFTVIAPFAMRVQVRQHIVDNGLDVFNSGQWHRLLFFLALFFAFLKEAFNRQKR